MSGTYVIWRVCSLPSRHHRLIIRTHEFVDRVQHEHGQNELLFRNKGTIATVSPGFTGVQGNIMFLPEDVVSAFLYERPSAARESRSASRMLLLEAFLSTLY